MIIKCIRHLIIIGLLVGIYSDPAFAQGTDLRGQVTAYNPYSKNYAPTANIKVDLYRFNQSSKRWDIVNTTYTDQMGMYYIFRVAPGDYFLQVSKVNYPIKVGVIDRRRQQFQDIPRIQIR